MSIKKYHSFGIFFEIKTQENCYETRYECSDNKQHLSTTIKNEANFCPTCGQPVKQIDYDIGTRFLNVWEVEKKAGLSEDTLFGTMENPEYLLKYFAPNRPLKGVINLDISSDETFMYSMNPLKSPKDYIEEAMQNEEFREIIERLENTFGDDFDIHFGVFSYWV